MQNSISSQALTLLISSGVSLPKVFSSKILLKQALQSLSKQEEQCGPK